MQPLLIAINIAVEAQGGLLSPVKGKYYQRRYRGILPKVDIESPPSDEQKRPIGQRGPVKQVKSRNLFERLRKFEDDVLRFMAIIEVAFTNNRGENDIRMTKVQLKIFGCFCSIKKDENFCLIHGYISICRKRSTQIAI